MLGLFSKLVVTGSAVLVGTLVGCQSSGTSASAGTTPSTQPVAVACDKCETTWVKTPNYAPGSRSGAITGFSRRPVMPCNDCVNIAKEWTLGFKGNMIPMKFEHKCKTCGGNVAICEAHKS